MHHIRPTSSPSALSALALVVALGCLHDAGAGTNPGDRPPQLADQLTSRLTIRQEPFALPDEALVIGDLHAWLSTPAVSLQAVFPRPVSTLDDLIANHLPDVRLVPSADFATNCFVIQSALLTAWQHVVTAPLVPSAAPLPPAVVNASNEDVVAAASRAFRAEIRKSVRARLSGITLSDAFIDGA